MFNVSTHRQEQLVADETTLLLRTMAVGLQKVTSASETVPSLSHLEKLVKAVYADKETITFEEFAQVIWKTREINEVATQWLELQQQGL